MSGAEEPTCASPAAWPDGPLAPRTWRGKASAGRVPSAGRASQKQCEVRATGGKERRARRGAAKTALVRVLLCRHTRASQPSGLATRMVPYAPGEGWQRRRACGQGKVEAEDVGAAGGEGGLTARAGAAVNLRAGARDVWRRGRGRGSGRAQSAVGSLHTCTLALLEGDVIDEAACIDVRRVRLRAGTLVECTPGSVQGTVQGGRPECCPGVGVGTGVGVAISRSRRDLAAAHVSQIELAPATYDVVELVARLLAKVRAGAGAEGGVEGSSTREQGPCCQGRAARGACTDSRVSSWP